MTEDWTKEIKERLEKATTSYHYTNIQEIKSANTPAIDIALLLKEREVLREALKFYLTDWREAPAEMNYLGPAKNALAYDPTKEKE